MPPPSPPAPHLPGAIVVPRSRFAPVKTCSDLFVLRSDVYVIAEDATVALAPALATAGPGGAPGAVPLIKLDDAHYKLVDQLEVCISDRVCVLLWACGLAWVCGAVPLIRLDDAQYKLVDQLMVCIKKGVCVLTLACGWGWVRVRVYWCTWARWMTCTTSG